MTALFPLVLIIMVWSGPGFEQSICATQKGSIILHSRCTLLCFLHSLCPTIYECFHCNLVACLLTACWICRSSRTSGQFTLSLISYTRITAHHIFIWHLKQALHYLEDGFVQVWWHASKFDAFQHFCLVYMLPKQEKFGMACSGFLKFLAYGRMKTISSWVPIVTHHVSFKISLRTISVERCCVIFIQNFE